MPQKLLLADDSVTIQRVIELTFADEDVQLTAVGDGKLAIESIEADPPDIVLADVGMPEKDGYEVAAYIKNNPRLAHIPVLLLTGAFEPVDEERARAAGCDGVLAKPFEPQMVITRVKELLADVARSRAPRRGPAMPVAPTAGEAGTPAAADDEFLLPEIAAFEAGSVPAEGSAASQLLAELDQRDADGPSEADAGDEAADEPVPDDYSVEAESPLDAAVRLRRRQPMMVPEFGAPQVETEGPSIHEMIVPAPAAEAPPSSGGAALDDYFSRLDAAFSTLNQPSDARPPDVYPGCFRAGVPRGGWHSAPAPGPSAPRAG
jgi:CheY-like chemotaxis protein